MKNLKNIIGTFERGIIILLIGVLGIILLFSSIELVVVIYKEMFKVYSNADILLDKKELIKVFGLVFNILIGLELFETVKLYLSDNIFHAEIILLVALIAISRKVIILDYEAINPLLVFAIGFLIFVLTIGYFFLKKGKSGTINKKNG